MYWRPITAGRHWCASGKGIRIDKESAAVSFRSDRTIVLRVLCNMLKNAFEATPKSEAISMGCHKAESPWAVEFKVGNKGVIPKEVQAKIFKSSFSTKGKGRGIGTYSIKLLGEDCLHGKVSFVSNKEDDTVFSLFLPS